MNELDNLRGSLETERWGVLDLRDATRRGQRRRWLMRMSAFVAASALVSLGVLTLPKIADSRVRQQAVQPAQTVGEGPPEGELLLQVNLDALVLDSTGMEQRIATGVDAFEFTASNEIAATTYSPADSTTVPQRDRLLLISEISKDRSVVTAAGPGAILDDPRLSPDGLDIVFTLARWPNDRFQGESVELLCVARAKTRSVECLQNPRELHFYAWNPNGTTIVAGGDGDRPVYLIERDSLEASVFMPPGGSDSIRSAMSRAGHGVPLQFVDLQWNSTGDLLAAVAMTSASGAIPIIFDLNGELIAMGEPNDDRPRIAWSPSADVLAYSKGVFGIPTAASQPGVFLLDASSGESEQVLDTSTHPIPWVFNLTWSPSGRWLAVSHESTIGFFQPTDPSTWYTIKVQGVDPLNGVGTLRDWQA